MPPHAPGALSLFHPNLHWLEHEAQRLEELAASDLSLAEHAAAASARLAMAQANATAALAAHVAAEAAAQAAGDAFAVAAAHRRGLLLLGGLAALLLLLALCCCCRATAPPDDHSADRKSHAYGELLEGAESEQEGDDDDDDEAEPRSPRGAAAMLAQLDHEERQLRQLWQELSDETPGQRCSPNPRTPPRGARAALARSAQHPMAPTTRGTPAPPPSGGPKSKTKLTSSLRVGFWGGAQW